MICAWFSPLRLVARGLLGTAVFACALAGGARAASELPVPPLQDDPWPAPADTDIPANYILATEALFAVGMADPRGCDYRTVVVRVGSMLSGDGGKTEVHGWLMPGDAEPRHAVCWNGLVYPVLSVGPAADLKRDVKELLTGRYTDRGWIPREADGVSEKHIESIKGCLLLRLGETELARDFWLSLQERTAKKPIVVRSPSERRTFGEKKPEEPAPPAKFDPQTPDPLVAWTTVWAVGALDRTLAAHMRGDDASALATGRWLAEVREKLKGLDGSPRPGTTNALETAALLDAVPWLVADQERRLIAPTNRLGLDRIAEIDDATNRVLAAVGLFDEMFVRQRTQFGGGVSWIDAPPFAFVLEEGQAAVEPLLAALESDTATRMTRSAGFERDYLPGRQLRPVSEALIEALKILLRLDDLPAVLPAATLAEAGTNAHRVAATALRGYIKRSNAMTVQESWYATLLDDKAGRDWEQAIRGIVAPSRSRSTVRRRPVAGAASSGTPLAGEILRTKQDPTVTELMVKRIGHWAPFPGEKTFGLGAYRNQVALLGRWDPAAALDLTEAALLDCYKVWEREAASPERNANLSKMSARAFSSLVVELAAAGRTNHLDLYAAWILKIGDQDYGGWLVDRGSEPNPLEPLWLYPDHPSIAEATRELLDPAVSRLRVWLPLSAGLRSFYVQEAGSRMSGVPAFQPQLIEALQDTSEMGTVVRPGSGRYEVKENTGVQYTRRLYADPFLSEKRADVKLRLCDAVAAKLSLWPDMPRFEVYWDVEDRDAKIAEYIGLIRSEGGRFGRRAIKERR